MADSCKKLFLRPHYRYQLKVFLNTRAYLKLLHQFELELCEPHLITFRINSEAFPKNHFEKMFPCFGRRSTIRTDSSVDDYLRKFYLSYSPWTGTYYVFRAERQGDQEVRYTLYEEILAESWQRLAATHSDALDGTEFLREDKVLHTVETHIYWQREIENIYINEMIFDDTPKVDSPLSKRGWRCEEPMANYAWLEQLCFNGTMSFLRSANRWHWPHTAVMMVNANTISAIIAEDPHMFTHQLEVKLHLLRNFVRQILKQELHMKNQLTNVDSTTLLVLCLSIMRNSLIPDEVFMVDMNKMESQKPESQKIKLYFDTGPQFNGSPHEGYPCFGKDSRNIPSNNQKYSNMFLLSSGPQENTLFLFSSLANENHYMIRSFIANIKFSNFYIQQSIFETYKPPVAGPSAPTRYSGPPAPPRPSGPSAPPRSSGPPRLPRPLVSFTPHTRLMPSAPPSGHYQPSNPSSSSGPPMYPPPPRQFAFPSPPTTSVQPSTFVQPTFSMPPSTSAPYTLPGTSTVPSSPYTFIPTPSGATASLGATASSGATAFSGATASSGASASSETFDHSKPPTTE